MTIPTLRSKRLRLRPFDGGDVTDMLEILSGEDVLRYFPGSKRPNRDQVARLVARMLEHWRERGYGLWAVTDGESGVLMGRCGLQYLPDTDEVEVDFILGRPYWGLGFATEAGRASLAYGFETMNFEKIVGIVHPENIPSQRVLEKLGMARIERTVYFGMDVYKYSIDRPVVRESL
jgi:RimJ/RimL family protein N-acetyltransferase